MSKPSCGGIKIDGVTLSTIEGVICEFGATLIDPDKLVTTCGGVKWDGDSFNTVMVDGSPVITHCPDGSTPIEGAMVMKANCGVGVDKRFFTMNADKELSLVNGYLLKVNATPADSTISVLNSSSQPVQPISGTTNQYICSGNVSVTVEKDGYIGKSQTINMTENKEVNVTLLPIVEMTVNVTTPASGATIAVTDADSHVISPKTGTTNVFQCEEGETYTVAVSATGYITASESVTMDSAKTVTVSLAPVV